MLSIPLIGMSGPQIEIWGIHLALIMLITAYLFGLRLVSRSQKTKMWSPRQTKETQPDEPENNRARQGSSTKLWLKFILYAAIVAIAGYVIARAGISISAQTGLSDSVAGGLFTAVSTSLPELVTTVGAVRQGALTLGIGGVIGGNCFDLLLLAFSDITYRQGSIYAAIANRQILVMALTILMTGILLLGLLEREKHGVGNIGFESLLILLIYAAGVAMLFV